MDTPFSQREYTFMPNTKTKEDMFFGYCTTKLNSGLLEFLSVDIEKDLRCGIRSFIIDNNKAPERLIMPPEIIALLKFDKVTSVYYDHKKDGSVDSYETYDNIIILDAQSLS